jgi:predicted dehydrogenase
MITPMRQTSSSHSRRQFVKGSVGAAVLTAASYRRVLGANERIGVGFVGFGLIGKRHVLDFKDQPEVNIVGICDAHRGRVAEGCELAGGCRGHDDFRKLLDDRDIDAVVISTPDHWHALMTMLACAAGKDVYVEKPLSLFVREGQWMIDVAARTNRVVQVGTQQRSGRHYQRARQLIADGSIGRVHSVRMQVYRNIMPGFGSPTDCPPPPELDWNSFLGPAPWRAYNPNRGIYHFRWFWDYSGGQMTNLGHHALDIMHWFLGGKLSAVSSSGGRFALQDNGETPDTQDALIEIRADENTPGVRYSAVWSHREASAAAALADVFFPMEFFGTKGSMAISRRGFKITADKKVPPENRVPQFAGAHPVGGPKRVETTATDEYWTQPLEDKSGNEREQFSGHVRNFLDCVKSRSTPISGLESAHRVSTMCHLANLSLRVGRKLHWDADAQWVADDAEVSAMLRRPYRAPWDAELRALGVS